MNILIVSSSYTGHGHTSIANALVEQFSLYPDVTVKVADGFEWCGEVGIRASQMYGPVTRHAKYIHRFTYSLGNAGASGVAHIFSSAMHDRFLEEIRRFPPDLIVTVHPMFNGSILNILEEMNMDIPVIAHQADLINIHATWCDPRAYRTIALTPEAREATIRQGVPAEKVILGGFPTRKAFCDAARNRVHLPYDGSRPFRCLIASGGEGSGNLMKYAEKLLENFNCKVTVLCGRNPRLKKKLETELSEYRDRLTALGFVDNGQDYMMDADFMIARSSPNTMMEAVVCNVPLILTGALPGQEEENPDLFVKYNLAVTCEGGHGLVRTVRELMQNNASRLSNIRAAQMAYRNLDNARNNAACIMDLYRQYQAGIR